MDLNAIYTELILEHNKDTRNKKDLSNPDLVKRGHNPSCGDDITLQIKLNGNIIDDISYSGVGCALSQASSSMMIDLIKGNTIEYALESVELFLKMIKSEIKDEETLENLGDAMYLQNISKMPARVKCAVLAWHTLKEALGNK